MPEGKKPAGLHAQADAPAGLLPNYAAPPSTLQIHLLGVFRVTVGSRLIADGAWRRRKAASLIKLLALAPDHRLHREEVTELLWPEFATEAGTNNLHRTLHAARRVLEPGLARASVGTYLRLNSDVLTLSAGRSVEIDAEMFASAAVAARRAGDPSRYEAALRLYGGDLLPEDRYEHWTAVRRDELRRTYLTLLIELARLYEGRGEAEAAIDALRRVVTSELGHEEAHTGLMRLHAAAGRRHEAVRQYQQLRDELWRELDAEPNADTQRLYRDIMVGRLPAARPTPAAPATLPEQVTSFVGREREIAEVGKLLGKTRLLTIVGAGGCGKTRIALQVASTALGEYEDGVWFVELAALSEPRLVPQAVASALALPDKPGRSALATLADHVRGWRALLVLDNCEHVVSACAELIERLLRTCPRVRILATSREHLGISGETIWRVPSLATPDLWRLPSRDELATYDAVRLFVERARSSQLDFTLTPDNVPAVVEICRRLDGIPLAIELAAARTWVLTPQQIAARLHDMIGLLTTGNRTSPPRQRTLQATIDWSYDLLPSAERVLLRRLSQFADGCTVEAAEAICTGSGINESEVLDLLAQLVSKSLVMTEARGGEARYFLLETIRQYGAAKLREAGETATLRRRHRDWYVQLAEQDDERLLSADQGAWLDRLAREYGNLRAALEWSTSEADGTEAGLRLAGALWRFWEARGPQSEGRWWLDELLASGRASAPVMARALDAAGNLARNQGDYRRATELLERALALRRGQRDRRGVAACLNSLGAVELDRGEYRSAAERFDEALAIWRELGERWGTGLSLHHLSLVEAFRGDHRRAEALRRRSLALYRELDHGWGIAMAVHALGDLARYRGADRQAEALYDESLARRRQIGNGHAIALSLTALARVAQHRGDDRRAAALGAESLALRRDLGHRRGMAASLEVLASVARGRQPERAARLLGAAAALREEIGAPLPPPERLEQERLVAELRATLGDERFAAAWAAGLVTTPERAVSAALDDAAASRG